MAIVARYIWGDKRNGKPAPGGGWGWIPWEPPLPRVERDTTGHWAVVDTNGSTLCLCVDRQGAERVVRRLRRAQVGQRSARDHATLRRTKAGWVYQKYYVRFGRSAEKETFATREEAVDYIRGKLHALGSLP